MIILGVDPGSALTGYGVVSKTRNKIEYIAHGTIETDKKDTDFERLRQLSNQLTKIINKYKPNAMAVERLYFFNNQKTAIKVSQAKGVILLAGAKKKLDIYEFTPPQIKSTIAGYGRAEKSQVQKMVKLLLKMDEIPKPDDAADALGVAICCAQQIS